MMRTILLITILTGCVETSPTLMPQSKEPDPGQPGSTEVLPIPDPVVECDPVAVDGCDQDTACVFTPEQNRAACERLDAELALEEPCNPGTFECGAGMTCTALPRDEETTCYAVCDPATNTGCENLPGSSPTYTCMQLEGLAYGVCAGAGIECNPNDDPCDDDEACSMKAGRLVCIPAGEAKIGDDCSREPCEKGAVCVNMTGAPYPTCFQPCDTSAGICPTVGDVCTGLEGHAFGVCQRSEAACDPLATPTTCPEGQTCSMDGLDVKCQPIGPTPIGGDCTAEPCSAGNVCAKLLGGPQTCLEPCDLDLPTCSDPSLECSSIGLGFGLCL